MKARFWATVLSLLFGAVLAWYLVYTRQLVNAVNADAKALSLMYAQVLQGVNEPDRESLVILFDMLEAIERLGVPVVVIAEDGQIHAARNLPFVAASGTADANNVATFLLNRHHAAALPVQLDYQGCTAQGEAALHTVTGPHMLAENLPGKAAEVETQSRMLAAGQTQEIELPPRSLSALVQPVVRPA